jgi:hypothetical protein
MVELTVVGLDMGIPPKFNVPGPVQITPRRF